jgi:PAS domain S-box-containing protein
LQKIILFFQNYSVALGTTVLTFLLTRWVGAWSDRTALALFMGAVVVSAYFQGLRAGGLATGLATFFLIWQYRLLPAESAHRLGSDFIASLVLFVVLALTGGYMARECLHAVRAATRQQNILANLRDALLLTDARGEVTFMNTEAQSLTGWSMPEAGKTPIDKILHLEDEDSRLPIKNPVTRLLTPGKDGQPAGNAVLVSREGNHKQIEYWAKPLYKADSSIAEVLVVFREIRDSVAAESEWKKNIEELDRKLSEEKQQQDNLRQIHKEQETKAQERIAELEKAVAQLQDQLAEGKRVAEDLRHEHDKKQENWKQTEAKLRQELAEAAAKGNKVAPEQLADWRRKEEELRREHAKKQEDWKQLEARLRRETAELKELSQLTEEELSQCRAREAELQKELQQLQEAQQQAETELHRQWEEERTLYHNELETQERGRKNFEFLALAGQSLAASLDYAVTLKSVATSALALPADACVVYALSKGAVAQPVAMALQGGPENVQVHDWVNGSSYSGPAAKEIGRLIQAEQPTVFAPIAEDLAGEITAALALSDGTVPVAGSALCLPLNLEGDFKGLVALVRREGVRPFAAEDQVVADKWVYLARQALAHARHAARATLPAPRQRWDGMPERMRPVMGRLRAASRTIQKELRDTAPLTEPIGILDDNIHRLSLFVDAWEVVHQLEGGEFTLNRKTVDLSSVINRTVETVTPFYRTRGHHLIVSLPLEAVWFSADADRLVLVLASLLDTTCFTLQSGGSIRLKVDHKPDALVFRIQDDSEGIPVPGVPAASRPDGETPMEWIGGRDGLTIGLGLVRRLVELHEGDIAMVWEGPEGGREIVLQLPALFPKPQQQSASGNSGSALDVAA